ncbi:MAG: metallophosphoesterase [Candidatus Thermoplasmatota archaeon]
MKKEKNKIEIWPDVFATRDYALHLPKKNVVIISDLHLGVEGVLRSEGVSLPQYQKKIILERLKKILKKYKPETLIVNGDFKHNFGKNLWQEWREVNEITDFLREQTEIILLRGNHDNFLKTIAVKNDIPFKQKYQIENIVILHGHKEKNIEKDKRKIIAHEHPFIKIRDKVGATLSSPCFLASENTVVMPAFSPVASGTNMITSEKKELLSPFLKKIMIEKFEVYAITDVGLLDFSSIGKLRKVVL